MTRKGNIILLILWILAILGVISFYVFRQVDRNNWYYGIYSLNFTTKEIKADVDEYVLQHNGTAPITVGIHIDGINEENIKNIKRFYTDYNKKEIDTQYSSWVDGTHYFAIPRIGGEYGIGADITYKDGTTIKSSQYFTGPAITIWTDVENPLLPIASLRTSPSRVALQDEVIFDISTKVNTWDQTDFNKNKQVLWDFDGDGTRDRTTQATTTRYRYINSNLEWKFKPQIAVLYKGFTWSAVGEISIK